MCFVLSLVGMMVLGCGKAAPNTTPIAGTLKTTAGAPCSGALVVFHPQEKERLNDPKPLAIVDAAGNFTVRTFTEDDGAVPGEYAVTVVWPAAAKEAKLSLSDEGNEVSSGPDRLKGAYGNPREAKFQVTIQSGNNPPLEFKVTE